MKFNVNRETLHRAAWGILLTGFCAIAVTVLKGQIVAVANYYNSLFGLIWWLFIWLAAWLLASIVMLFTGFYWSDSDRGQNDSESVHPLITDFHFIEDVSPYVGCLGTFLGLYNVFTNLVLDPANIMATVPVLIQGIGKALLTSVVGVIGYLVAKFLRERIAPKVVARQHIPQVKGEDILEVEALIEQPVTDANI